MFEPLIWQDEVRSPDNTFSVTHNADGTVTTKRAGEQIQKGTNQSATNFNFMSNQGFEAGLIASLLTQEVVQHKRKIEDLDGQTIEVTLSNSLSYPFNNSKKTVSIDTKDTLDYRVAVELIEDVPNVGEIIITDKQINGFKIAYTGSAKSVKVRYGLLTPIGLPVNTIFAGVSSDITFLRKSTYSSGDFGLLMHPWHLWAGKKPLHFNTKAPGCFLIVTSPTPYTYTLSFSSG